MSTGIDGAKALASFVNVADKFTKGNSVQGEKLSAGEKDVLQNMLASMNDVQRKMAITDLKTYNPGAASQLK